MAPSSRYFRNRSIMFLQEIITNTFACKFLNEELANGRVVNREHAVSFRPDQGAFVIAITIIIKKLVIDFFPRARI